MFTNSSNVKLEIFEGGKHILNRSHFKEVDAAVIHFVRAFSG